MTNLPLQATIARPLEWTGTGLHSGKPVTMRLVPAAPKSGIRVVRVDLPGSPEIPCRVENVTNTQMATTLGLGKASVSTVEHLLCAVYAAGIDNLRIELNAPEVPISDGSSIEFFRALREMGVERQAKTRQVLRLKAPVRVQSGDKWATAEPSEGFSVQAEIEFSHPSIGKQAFAFVEGETPAEDFLAARTYGFLKEVEALKKMGLAQGGSLDNAVVLDDHGVLNPGGLRFANEFARHKVLDALGDLMLAGHRIQARIELSRSGHELHRQLVQAILANAELVDVVDTQRDRVASAGRPELFKKVRRVAVS
jgi:UDP-3-O-[3-hydroxymyristoyl] N-acetylglucosamine deacetylase